MRTGRLPVGAWISLRTCEWRFADEQADRVKQPGNLASIGLPAAAREAIKDIANDCSGESRKKIPLAVKAAWGTLKVDATRKGPK